MKLSIIIPIRNEESLVKKVIEQLQVKLKSLPYEIIFVNDFSTDNTAQVTKELINNLPKINIYENDRKGLGGAIIQGINKSNGDVVCIMMSDLSDNINDLETYYDIIKNEDVDAVFGSRFIHGSKVVDYPRKKLILNRIFNFITKSYHIFTS